MSIRTEPWADGTPCWADLATTDLHTANTFYSSLFGWTIIDAGEDMGHYGMCMLGGYAAAGIGPKQRGDTSPPAWITYLASSDAAKTAESIVSAGGSLLAGPMDIGDDGRMLMAQDPTGAVFGVWEAGTNIGASIVNEPGSMGWNELCTRDTERARTFYSAVFGYRYTRMEGDLDYVTIDGAGPGNTIGGIGQLDADAPPDLPPYWMTYFVVTDADQVAATATDGGGSVVTGPFDTPFGRMAVIRDPQGAVFSIAGVISEATAGR